jgi:hypothetical protein
MSDDDRQGALFPRLPHEITGSAIVELAGRIAYFPRLTLRLHGEPVSHPTPAQHKARKRATARQLLELERKRFRAGLDRDAPLARSVDGRVAARWHPGAGFGRSRLEACWPAAVAPRRGPVVPATLRRRRPRRHGGKLDRFAEQLRARRSGDAPRMTAAQPAATRDRTEQARSGHFPVRHDQLRDERGFRRVHGPDMQVVDRG